MIFTNHVQGSGAGLGAVQLTADQRALLASAYGLSEQERRLRNVFKNLVLDVGFLANNGRAVGPGLLKLLHAHNAAVAAHLRAGMIWIEARARVPKSELPDPGVQPVAIPTFGNLPAISPSLGDAGPAAAITVNYGYIGSEQQESIISFVGSGRSAATEPGNAHGLGSPFAVIPFSSYLFGFLVTAALVVVVWGWASISGQTLRLAELDSKNRLSAAKVKLAEIDERLYNSVRAACEGSDKVQLTVRERLACLDKADETLALGKTGRDDTGPPFAMSPVITVGIMLGLGALSWGIYTSIKRKQRGRDTGPSFGPPPLPRVAAMGPRADGGSRGPRGPRAQPLYPDQD